MSGSILCSTGALIGRPNGRDYRLLKQFCPRLECDGFEFIMYGTWYNEVDAITEFLTSIGLSIPVMHSEKSITEHIARGGEEEEREAFRLFEINCRMAEAIGAQKIVIHLWNGLISDTHFENNLRSYPMLYACRIQCPTGWSCTGIIRISGLFLTPKWRIFTDSLTCCTHRNMIGCGRKTISCIIT